MSIRLKLIVINSLGILAVLLLFGLATRTLVWHLGIDQVQQNLRIQSRPFIGQPPGGPPPRQPGFPRNPGPPQGNTKSMAGQSSQPPKPSDFSLGKSQHQTQPWQRPPPDRGPLGYGTVPGGGPGGPGGDHGPGRGPGPYGGGPGPGPGGPGGGAGPNGGPNGGPFGMANFPKTESIVNVPSANHANLASLLPVSKDLVEAAKSNGSTFGVQSLDGANYELIYFRFGPPGSAGVARMALPLDQVQHAVQLIDAGLLLMIPAAIGLSLLIAAVITKTSLGPISKLTDQAKKIDANRLEQRLPESSKDEFGQLGKTLNAMLTKIESGFRNQQRLLENQRRFTSDAAHELKSPLTVIAGNAQLATNSQSDQDIQASLTEITRESASMTKIVQDLLLLSRLESTAELGNRVTILVKEILDSAIEALEPDRRNSVVLSIEPPDLLLFVEENSIKRLFRNLLENAQNASEPGSTITLIARVNSDLVEIQVQDQGRGIPESALPHLGERFYRVDEARTRSAKEGTGLGLAICKEILSRHGGNMVIQSTVGVGTIVSVTLPRTASDQIL